MSTTAVEPFGSFMPECYQFFNAFKSDPVAKISLSLSIRTTGFNSIRTLAARLSYFKAVSGNLLSCLPLELKLRGKSTTQSHRAAVYYVDLTIRDGMSLEDAIIEATATNEQRKSIGHDQGALDEIARVGFANGAFEESEDEIPAVLEEFYPEGGGETGETGEAGKSTLQAKLERKAGTTT